MSFLFLWFFKIHISFSSPLEWRPSRLQFLLNCLKATNTVLVSVNGDPHSFEVQYATQDPELQGSQMHPLPATCWILCQLLYQLHLSQCPHSPARETLLSLLCKYEKFEASPKVPQLIGRRLGFEPRSFWHQRVCLFSSISYILRNKGCKYLLEALASLCVRGSVLSLGPFLPGAIFHRPSFTGVCPVSQPVWFYLPQISLGQI